MTTKKTNRGRFSAGCRPGPGRPRRSQAELTPADRRLAERLIAESQRLIDALATLITKYDDQAQ